MSSATNPPAPAPTAPPARRWRKRWTLIPGALILAALVALGILYVRGTWADTEPRNPATVAEGPISHVFQHDGSNKTVRCSVILPHPVEDVWEVLTDYGKYHEMMPYLKDIKAEEKGTDEWRMTGQAKSVFRGYWPFDITIRQKKDEGRIWWDEKSRDGEVRVNRGGWVVTKHGDKETLLVLTLEAEVDSTPTFVLRSFFLYRLKQVVRAVEQAVQRRKQGS